MEEEEELWSNNREKISQSGLQMEENVTADKQFVQTVSRS